MIYPLIPLGDYVDDFGANTVIAIVVDTDFKIKME